MNFCDIDWADSDIEKIEIEYNCATLFVFNDTLQKQLIVEFNGFIGLTNLLIWDDQIIDHAEVHEIQDNNSTPFIQMLFATYDKDFNYGERWLNKGILEVQIHLVNHTFFSLYCQSIDITFG